MLGAHTLAEGRQGSRYKEPIVAMVQAFYALTRGLEILRLVSGRLRKGGGGGVWTGYRDDGRKPHGLSSGNSPMLLGVRCEAGVSWEVRGSTSMAQHTLELRRKKTHEAQHGTYI